MSHVISDMYVSHNMCDAVFLFASQVQVKYDDEDEGDAVTYSTVKVSSSSAGASDDPSSFYASVKKQAK